MKLSALQLCVRAARQLTVENPRHTFAKPVRVAALYQISSLCIKACFRALRWLGSGEDGAIVDSLALIEECMGLLLPASAVAIAGTAASSSAPVPAPDSSAAAAATVVHAELAEVSTRVWSALLSAWAGLKECRRLDSFDFRSVYRVSDSSRRLAALVSGGEVPLPPQWVVERLKGLGVRELGATAALEELARLFDRKRSQIVAMWCVENAVSPWEKVRFDLTMSLH